MSEAGRRAKIAYRSKCKRITVEFYPTEADLVAQIERQPLKQTYIKNLIRADIERQKEGNHAE